MLSSRTNIRVCDLCRAHEPLSARRRHWIRPCSCLVWVHRSCLLRAVWRYEAEQPGWPLVCSHCYLPYHILPQKNSFVVLLELFNYVLLECLCEIFADCWCFAVAEGLYGLFGLMTLSLVVGRQEVVVLITSVNPWVAWGICRYAIPWSLFIVGCSTWDDVLLQALRKASGVPLFGRMMPTLAPEVPEGLHSSPPHMCLVSAVLLPVYSVTLGRLLFCDEPPVRAALLGCAVFTTLTGLLRMYYKQKIYSRQGSLDVHDYHDPLDT